MIPKPSASPNPWRRPPRTTIPTAVSPLVLSAVVFAVATFLGARWPTILILTVTALLIIASIAVVVRPRPRGRWASVWIVPPLLLGLHLSPPTPEFDPSFGPHRVVATVISAPRAIRSHYDGPPRQRLTFEIERVDGEPHSGRVRFLTPLVPIGRGDRVEFDYWHHSERTVQRIRHPAHIHSVRRSAWSAIDRWRKRIWNSWSARFSPAVSAWFQALLLGERSAIDDATRQRFRDIGQSHLLAISGLHVGIIAAFATLALSRIGVLRTTPRRIAVTLLLIMYAGLAGADPAVIRATVLGTLATLAVLRRRSADALNALCCSFIVLAVAMPTQTADLGFILTFTAVLGIVLLGTSTKRLPVLDRRRRRVVLQRLSHAFRISIAAWLGAAIPLALIRPEVTPLAPAFALVLTPLVAGLLGLGLLAVYPMYLDPVIDGSARLILALLNGCAAGFDTLPATPARWPLLPPVTIALALSAVALTWCGGRARRPAVMALVAAIIMAVLPGRTPCVVVPDLGRGQAILIVTSETTVLADAGSVDRSLGGADIIATELWRNGRSHLDTVVLSHPHADHVLAILELLQRVTIGRVWVGPSFDKAPLGVTVLRQLDQAGVPWQVVTRGDRATVGDLDLSVVYPPADLPASLRTSVNDGSIVLRVRHRHSRLDVIIPGDLEGFGLARTATQFESTATIVILPHHGRPTTGLERWLASLDPDVLIASSVGRPSDAVKQLARRRTVLLTSVVGDIRVTATSRGWSLETRLPGWKSLGAWSTVRSP